jgi:hypothetical protein
MESWHVVVRIYDESISITLTQPLGTDGVTVWNMCTRVEIRAPNKAGLRGVTTTLTLLPHEDELEVSLVYI